MTPFEKFKTAFSKHISDSATHADMALVSRIFSATHNMMEAEHLISPITPGNEGMLASIPTLNFNRSQKYSDVGVESINAFLDTCCVPEDMKSACANEVARIISGDNSDAFQFYNPGRAEKRHTPPGQIYSSATMAELGSTARQAVESFGMYSDRVTSDSRLAVALTVLRSHRSLIDRVMPRRAAEDPVVIIKIPSPEVYNLELSQNASAAVRYGNHRTPLIDLYRNPSPVNTQPQQIVALHANDTSSVYTSADNVLLIGSPPANLFDLSNQSNVVGFNATDWTDLVAEGGSVGTLFFTITSGSTTETYSIVTQYNRNAQFTTQTNVADSGDRAATMQFPWALTKNAVMTNGSASALLNNFVNVSVVLNFNFTANLNIKSSYVSGNGSVTGSLFTTLTGGPGSTLTTAFNAMTFAITGWTPYLFFSEENMRKTTGAVRMTMREQEFLIPMGRNYIVDYSLMGQEIDTATTETTSRVMSIGNSIRSINIIQNTLTAVNGRLQFENNNPEIGYFNSAAMDYAAGTLSLPHVYIGTIDLTATPFMRESEHLSDMHSFVANRLTALIADAHNKSMYPNNFESGESPRWKVMTSGPIAEILFGIKQYWSTLNDTVTVSDDSNYSMKLPNGTQLDIYQSNFTVFNNTMILIPVRSVKPDDITSFGVILDKGTYVGQYTLAQNSAANRRIVANSREILFPTNPLGMVITVAGISAQLGVLTDGPGLSE